MTGYCLWRAIASLVPDLSKNFREAHYELARLTQVREPIVCSKIFSLSERFLGCGIEWHRFALSSQSCRRNLCSSHDLPLLEISIGR